MNKVSLIRKGFTLNTLPFSRPCIIMNLDNKFMSNDKYINIKDVEQSRDIMALFKNIRNYDDFYTSSVVELTHNARMIGIKKGMSGSKVIDIYEKRKKLELAHVVTGI
jgi:uncharacterized protein YunC (DUF1805 family)